ncbi:MAG: TylF/MycF/NovP-related O-methyltransferase, partial [Bdellovibrionota bacterium]
MKTTEFDYKQETKATDADVHKRQVLYDLFNGRPMPDDQLMICLGLYMRSSALAKILFVNELYELIKDVPGDILEFGTWWGQNLVLFENLRAIYEPFNQSRRVIGFDTFKGYPEITEKDRRGDTLKLGGYTVSANYKEYLEKIIAYHESNNILSNIKKHSLVEGDISVTAKAFFEKNPGTIVALAYFDTALYKPTKAAIEAILPHLVPGSVVMFDELNNKD